MDAITLLRDDHKTVEGLFKKFEKAGPNAKKTKRDLVDKIVTELAVHAAIEELVFYPAIRASVEETEDMTLESLEEHHIVKWVLAEIEDMSPDEERFEPKVTVLMENVRHHVEEEESDLFPMVRKGMSRTELRDLGARLQDAKRTAPTRPHPKAPDTPPGNVVAAAAAAPMDRARRAGKRAVSAAAARV